MNKLLPCLLLSCCLLMGCRFSYLNPGDLNIRNYQKVVDELLSKRKADPIFLSKRFEHSLDLGQFEDIGLQDALPSTFRMLKAGEITDVHMINTGCILLKLKHHRGIFIDNVEVLKFGDDPNCTMESLGSYEIEKDVTVKEHWRYQIYKLYIE